MNVVFYVQKAEKKKSCHGCYFEVNVPRSQVFFKSVFFSSNEPHSDSSKMQSGERRNKEFFSHQFAPWEKPLEPGYNI